MNFLSRTELLIGRDSLEKLKSSQVAIFGIGGVGSYTAEALGRCGIGKLVLIDYDIIDETNINRQIHSTANTIGRVKVEVMKERLLEINPSINVDIYNEMYCESTSNYLISKEYDYVIDAIDMVSSKIDLIVKCIEAGIPIVSSMGAGNKMDPTKFEVADIYDTTMCPLAKVMRRELKKRGVQKLKVVFSKEKPLKQVSEPQEKDIDKSLNNTNKKTSPGSISFVPSVAGLILASVVVRDIIRMSVDN